MAFHENGVVAGNQGCHGVISHGLGQALRKNTRCVHYRSEPEPELQDDTKKLSDIAEEDIQHSQCDAEPYGKCDLDNQKREDAEEGDAWEVAGSEEECSEEAKNNAEVQEGVQHHDARQAVSGKADFF